MENKKSKNSGKNKGWDNLKPFKSGESGNPNGRPKGQKNYATLYREALIKLAKANKKTPDELELEILSKGILNARAGDYRFYKDLLDRLHGTAISRAELTGKDGKDLMPDQKKLIADSIEDYLNGHKGNTK
ncbi:MAG: hypothetical protein GX625_16390 [Clostridiaceae bacterium]|nr:hypothetical protein [Clostridiaceae bacterium]